MLNWVPRVRTKAFLCGETRPGDSETGEGCTARILGRDGERAAVLAEGRRGRR